MIAEIMWGFSLPVVQKHNLNSFTAFALGYLVILIRNPISFIKTLIAAAKGDGIWWSLYNSFETLNKYVYGMKWDEMFESFLAYEVGIH